MKKSVTKIDLRLYQNSDVQAIEKAWSEFRSVLYQLPTGGGKSVVISKLVSDYRNEQIIILAHKRRLLTQLYDRLVKLGINTGLLFGSRSENLDAKILVVSIRTAVKDARLEKLLERKWDRVIIDEARHSRTGSYDKVLDSILEKYPTHKLLGVDATPYRKDGKRLDKHFQTLVTSSETTASLIEKGYLCKYRTYQTPLDQESLKEAVKEVAGDYQSTELSNYMRQSKYIDYAINLYKQKGENRQTIVFAVDKAHARDLKVAFENAGFAGKVAQIDSDMSQQEIDNAFEAYEKKKIQFLINVEMVTEGVDLPNTGCILGLRPTKSLTLYLQIVGRGTRLKEDGSDLIILDCCGWTEEYGVLSSPKHWSLDPEIDPNNPRTKNKVVGKLADGTYTEDLTDYVGELVEMTPEEYIKHLSGGFEAAKQVNVSIEDKMQALVQKMASLITELLSKKETEYRIYSRIDYDTISIYLYHSSISEKDFKDRYYRYNHILVKLTRSKQRLLAVHNTDDSDYEQNLYISSLTGTINKELYKQHVERKQDTQREMQGLYKQIIDLEKSKINLQAYKRQAEEFEYEQWQKKVEETLKKDGILQLPVSLRDYIYFAKVGGYNNIAAIEIPNKAINKHHNTIILHLQKSKNDPTFTSERKYVKGEKVWEIIKDAKWGKEVEQLIEQ